MNITVAAGVTPAATVISSNTDTYTFGGAAIGGGTLTKSGADTAVFTAANSFSGVSVGGGLVQATVANAVGSAAPISLTGGTLESQLTGALGTGAISFNGGTLKATTAATQTYANAWSIGASGGIIDVAGGTTLTMSTNVTATTSTLTKNGTGTLVISGAFGGTYTGSSLGALSPLQ